MPQSQPSRDNKKKKRDDAQIMTKKNPTTYETTDTQTKKNCNRRTTLEWSVGKPVYVVGMGVCVCVWGGGGGGGVKQLSPLQR